CRAGLRHHRPKFKGIIRDPMHTKTLTAAIEPHDHRPSTMKVDTDILSIHRGLLLLRGCVACGSPESRTGLGTFTRSGGPAPSSHQFGAFRHAELRCTAGSL